jgi:hypothetical protein
MEEFCKGFNTMTIERKGVHVNYTCSCDICGPESDCNAHLHTFEGITLLWQSIVYPKGLLDENHKLDCLHGQCNRCGIHNLKLCPQEVVGNGQIMEW